MTIIYKSLKFDINKITLNGCYYNNKKILSFDKDNKLHYYCSYDFISYFLDKTDVLYLNMLDIFNDIIFKDIKINYIDNIFIEIFSILKNIYSYEDIVKIYNNINLDYVFNDNNDNIINFLYFYKYIHIFINALNKYYSENITDTLNNFNNFKNNLINICSNYFYIKYKRGML